MTELVSQAEFARHRGVSKKSVTIWKQRGYLVWRDGQIDRDASDRILDSRGTPGNGAEPQGNDETPPTEPGNAGSDDPPEPPEPPKELQDLLDNAQLLTTAQAERVKENYLARQRKLQYERDAGELVPVDEVVRQLTEKTNVIRSKILALPTEAAPQLAQEFGVDANLMRERLSDAVTRTLENLTDVIARYEGESD